MRPDFEGQFARFTEDVQNHRVTVLRDDGLYRHLRCSKGSYVYQFDVVTWPHHLAYSGDMGSFMFSRIEDMFEFFRGRRSAVIDRQYLAEKAVAVCKTDGLKRFSAERFRSLILELAESHAEGYPQECREDLLARVRDEVLWAADQGQDYALRVAGEFEFDGSPVFHDLWDHGLEEHTARFWWCCYAVPWAIEQYDRLKGQAA